MSRSCSSRLDGGGDALIAAAAADVAAHRVVDLGLGRVLRRGQQRSGLHDLAGLAITALRYIQGAPGPLHRMVPVPVEALDRRYRAAADIADGSRTSTRGLAV